VYRGELTGMAEVGLAELRGRKQLVLVRGFGVCARAIAGERGLVGRWSGSLTWPGRELFSEFSVKNLNNGLSEEQNQILASSPYMDDMVFDFMRGLYGLRKAREQQHKNMEKESA